jgi:hypothetical protein
MNERIEQLIESCTYVDSIGVDETVYYSFDKEKFAELIVRECAGIYSKIDNGNLHMGTDDYLEALHKTFRS